MAEYKGIKGFKTQSYATDPVAATAAWSSGGSLNTSRRIGATALTAPTSAGQIGGGGPATSPNADTEQYDGTSWSQVNDMIFARFGIGGTGTQANAIGAGGFVSPPGYQDLSESWNGTCWSEGNNILTARYQVASAGTGDTSALIAGGEATPSATTSNACETYNGTSWTETADLGTARYGLSGGGTATAALAIGGLIAPGANSALLEEWNGTSWSEGSGDLNTARGLGGAAVTDTENALYFAGNSPPTACKLTEKWNGTSWTETSDLSTGRAYANGSGTETAALCFAGGALPPGGTGTEEFNDYSSTNPAPSATMLNEGQIWYNTTGAALKYTAKAGAWATGGVLPSTRRNPAGVGTQTAALAAMGTPGSGYPAVTTNCDSYDGTAWTATNPTQNARTNQGACQIGTQAAGQIQGGYSPGPTGNAHTEQFDGTSWTEKNNLLSGRWSGCGAGITTAGLYFGGTPAGPASTTANEEWDGTSWSEDNDMSTARRYLCGGGTTTAALGFGGGPPGTTLGMKTESWNGTSWSDVSDLNGARQYLSGIAGPGAQTSCVAVGGQTSPTFPATNGVETWDGTSWSTAPTLGTGRSQMGGNSGAPGDAGCVFGGSPYTTATEEWTVAETVKTVTVS